MKKIYTLIGILMLISSALFAQTPANRTANTIVADILAQVPYDKQSDYNNSIKALMSTKETGVLQLVGMMKAPADGNNSKIEYALSGLTFFVANQSEADRLDISNAYVKALSTTTERETLAFVIRQLEYIGKDEAVAALAKYLSDESLAGPAARALARIGTSNAKKAFAAPLASASSDKIKTDLVAALGSFGNNKNTEGFLTNVSSTEEIVKQLLKSNDKKLQQVAVQTLGKIGTKESIKDLGAIAKKNSFQLDNISSTGAYLNLIDRLIDDKSPEGEKAAKALMSDAKKAKACNARQGAAQLLMKTNPAGASKQALDALKDPCSQYRIAMLKAASQYNTGGELYGLVIKDFPKAKEDVKTSIADWIEVEAKCPDKRSKMQTMVQPLADALVTKDLDLQTSLSRALVSLENKDAIAPLVKLLTSENGASVNIAKEALSRFKGDITGALVSNIANSNDVSKIAILDLLALRKSSKHLSDVISLTNTGSDDVKKAAFNTIKDVVEAKDINSMYTMLEGATGNNIAPLQQAVISALALNPADKQYSTIADKISKTPDSKKYLYYTALASTQNKEALAVILDGFNKGNKEAKDAAVEALTNWKDISGAEHLLSIAQDSKAGDYFDKTLSSYIRMTASSQLSNENKLINLREAMAIAKTDAQKNQILRQVQNTGTFQALTFAGQYLDNNAIKDAAAQAVMNIAFGNKSFIGKDVEALLKKASTSLTNPDAGYQREGITKHLREVPMDNGYVSIFNGKDLTGWKGLVQNPIAREKMSAAALSTAQAKADEEMHKSWYVENGQLIFRGKGDNICTDKQYGDFEMYVDWMLDPAGPEADAGIYLRGTPQVQIWDIARTNVGAEVGSGGLYNNQTNESKPSKVADNKLGMWNTFYIKMVGDRVSVHLNGEVVVDNVILENYWNRKQPIFAMEQIELQAHGCKVYYRDIYVKELEKVEPFELSAEEKKEGFEILFDGTNMHKWTGNTEDYILEDNCISLHPGKSHGGNLYTKEEYANFVYRFEFQLTPGANNGVGIRTPLEGDAAYVGMEVQILDHDNPIYNTITPLQVHGSVYGVMPAKRAKLKPAGEWNYEEIVANGDNIKVTLNGEVILEGNLKEAVKNGAADGHNHPGVKNKTGHIAFLGHGNPVKFKNIRVKRLK